MGGFLHPLAPLLDEEVAWGSCAKSINCPPIPRLFNLRTVIGIWRAFFFGGYGACGSAPQHLLLSGGVACDMATCHAQISWGISVPMKPFSFPTFFKAPFFKSLSSSSHFFIFLLRLLTWFLNSFCAYSFDYSVSSFSQVHSFLCAPFSF